MKVCRSNRAFNNSVLPYVIAICAAAAPLVSGLSSVVAEELEGVPVPEGRTIRDAHTTPAQTPSVTSASMLSSISSSDIAAILKNNPSLLVSLGSSSATEDDAADFTNTENAGGSTIDLPGPGYERNLTLVNSMIDSI